MTVISPPFVQQGGSHPAATFRETLMATMASPFGAFAGGVQPTTGGGGHGIAGPADLTVTQNGTPNMSVNVAGGTAFIRGTEAAAQGVYCGHNDATVNLAVSAADPTNPRWDLVVMRVRDAFYSGASTDVSLAVITGTPAASPADPTVPANSIVLARIVVAAAAGSIVNANITALAPRATALGGVYPCFSNLRPTGSAVFDGLIIYELDTFRLYIQSNGAWRFLHHPSREDQVFTVYVPDVNVDATTSAAWVDWLTIGNVTVPPWATKARVAMTLTGLSTVTATGNQYATRLTLGGSAGAAQPNFYDPAGNDFGYTILDLITPPGTGSQSLKVQAYRLVGSGRWRANTRSRVDVWIDWY